MRPIVWSALLLAGLAAALPFAAGVSAQDKDPTLRNLDEYKLRVGDKVEIQVFNGSSVAAEINKVLTVPANGQVSLPPVGRIELLDRTVFEVQQEVADKFKSGGFFANPNVGCVVVEFEPRPVFLMGAIQGQVFLPIHRNMRILEVLAKAGNIPATRADFTKVRVRRFYPDGRSANFEVNVEDILERNQDQQNVVIFENDIIIVPRLETTTPQAADWVYVIGKVHTPGRQPIIKGKTAFTLTKLIAICGDFQEFADRTKIKVIRSTPTGREQFVIDFDEILDGDRPDFEMRPDDLVFVPENWI